MLWVEALAASMNVWLRVSSVTMSTCAETGRTPASVRKHQRRSVLYALSGRTLHLTYLCIELWFCWTEGVRTEIEGRNVDLSLFKGVLIHLVYLFYEAEKVKIGFSTQMCAGEVCSALPVGCCWRPLWPSLTLWHHFLIQLSLTLLAIRVWMTLTN